MGEDVGEDTIAARSKRRRVNNAERNLFSYAEVNDDVDDDDFVDEPKKK